MTKKLSETFGFEEQLVGENEIIDIDETDLPITTSPQDQILEETGITDHEREMNEIMRIAIESHEKCIEFGFGVEAKNSSPGLSASTSYLNIALNASKSKVEKKMSLYRLSKDVKNNTTNSSEQETTLELDENGNQTEVVGGQRMSRNDLIEELKSIIEETTVKKS